MHQEITHVVTLRMYMRVYYKLGCTWLPHVEPFLIVCCITLLMSTTAARLFLSVLWPRDLCLRLLRLLFHCSVLATICCTHVNLLLPDSLAHTLCSATCPVCLCAVAFDTYKYAVCLVVPVTDPPFSAGSQYAHKRIGRWCNTQHCVTPAPETKRVCLG